MKQSIEHQRKRILDRIKSHEEAIQKATEYLATGKHAQWSGFRARFVQKVRNGKELPPHADWVKNVFLPRQQMALDRAERMLERFSE